MGNKSVESEIQEILDSLSKNDQSILARVIKIERDHLHIENPRVKEEILSALREVIK
jgi:hypothetical protein